MQPGRWQSDVQGLLPVRPHLKVRQKPFLSHVLFTKRGLFFAIITYNKLGTKALHFWRNAYTKQVICFRGGFYAMVKSTFCVLQPYVIEHVTVPSSVHHHYNGKK